MKTIFWSVVLYIIITALIWATVVGIGVLAVLAIGKVL